MKLCTFFIACLTASRAIAGDWSSLYQNSKLEAEKPRLQKALDYVLDKEIQPFLPATQRLSFSLKQIDLPLKASVTGPMSVYSENEHIEFPLQAMLFTEDLARAYAWLWTNRYTTKTVDEYLAMLRYRKPDDFPEHTYPSPLAALHIPDDALNDPRVVDMAVRTRRTAYAFLLLHEFAHVRLETLPDAKFKRAEDEEELADEYALDILKSNSTTPTGVLLVMQSWMILDAGNPAADHQVTAGRLYSIAHYLDNHAIEFVRGRPNQKTSIDAIHSMAVLLRQGAEYLAVPGHEAELRELALKTNVATLKPRLLPKTTQ